MNSLAWLLATHKEEGIRNGDEAVALAEELIRRGGDKSPIILDTLAAAYAEQGRYEDAVRTAQNALNLAQDSEQPELSAEIEKHLSYYEKSQPWRRD
jgi:tetratricopeptide (TPR) repeat protein